MKAGRHGLFRPFAKAEVEFGKSLLCCHSNHWLHNTWTTLSINIEWLLVFNYMWGMTGLYWWIVSERLDGRGRWLSFETFRETFLFRNWSPADLCCGFSSKNFYRETSRWFNVMLVASNELYSNQKVAGLFEILWSRWAGDTSNKLVPDVALVFTQDNIIHTFLIMTQKSRSYLTT